MNKMSRKEAAELIDFHTCPTGKDRHDSKHHAKRLAKKYRSRYKRKFYVYRCEVCNGFHLTKMDRDTYRRLKSRKEATQ